MRLRSAIVALALAATTAAATHAQDVTLDRVQNLVSAGRFTEARTTLEQWEKTHGDPASTATTADRARALFLRGALSTDPQDAEDAFVGVVLSYPSSAVAPEALLRLGQSLLTAGDARRAVGYLARLRDDYPAAPQRETGALWLARAQLALGSSADACATARAGLNHTSNANLRTLIEIERDRACAAAGIAVEPATRRPAGADEPASSPPVAAPASPPAASTPAVLNDMRIATDEADDAPPNPRDGSADVTRDTRPRDDSADAARPSGMRVTPIGQRVPRTTPMIQPAPADDAGTTRPHAGNYAVQIAAFRVLRSAETILAELRARGFDARLVTTDDPELFRIRFGTFASSRDAAAAALQIRDAGFAALIVDDVRAERTR